VTEIGLISDTHGLLRASVHEALAGVSLILHAGDVCGDTILDELALIAPVQAVRGNCDPPWEPGLAPSRIIEVEGVRIHLSHGHELGRPGGQRLAEAYPGFDVIVYGHTHIQKVERVGQALVVNPGAAGPRRYDLPATVARLSVEGGDVSVVHVELAE
jgi:putative phosphoesterase